MKLRGEYLSTYDAWNLVKDHLKLQIDFTNRFYSWDLRKNVWNKFLQGVVNARSK